MNKDTICGVNSQFFIFITLLISFNIIMFYIINKSYEKFPYGSYQRNQTYGRISPRSRDRDSPEENLSEENDVKNDQNSVNAIQHIDTDLDSENYKWNGNINFPYGGFVYERTYPVYPAPNICDTTTPYWSTLEGKCIDINQEEQKQDNIPNISIPPSTV
jgi:hypothetical protein